jgi:hypothetical protein
MNECIDITQQRPIDLASHDAQSRQTNIGFDVSRPEQSASKSRFPILKNRLDSIFSGYWPSISASNQHPISSQQKISQEISTDKASSARQ